MKLSQEQAEKLKQLPSAAKNPFSKYGDFKAPDSPPPEKEESEDDPNKPSKFDQMMKAACSIKSAQMEQQRRKFELLPSFLKSGVYFSQRHEVIRNQNLFSLKMISFELINKDGNYEVAQGNFDRACHRYEEALSIFHYFETTDPNWQSKGIDDDHLKEVHWVGQNEEQKEKINNLCIKTLLNIAACNLKTRMFESAIKACDEVLKLEKNNITALYRRARAIALQINAGVPELRLALKDLKQIFSLPKSLKKNLKLDHVEKERDRIQDLIDVNFTREKETYQKMFSPTISITDIVKEIKNKNLEPNYKTIEEKEFDKEMEKLKEEVKVMTIENIKKLSFGVKPGWENDHYPECDDVQIIIDKAVESYRLLKKAGKYKDAKQVFTQLKDTMYAKEHIKIVMNMDFQQPNDKMQKMAAEHGVDIRDPRFAHDFRKIQLQNLKDIRLMKEGKHPLSHDELQEQLRVEREQEYQKRMEQIEKSSEDVQDLLKNQIEIENEPNVFSRDFFFVIVVVCIWLCLVLYSNIFI